MYLIDICKSTYCVHLRFIWHSSWCRLSVRFGVPRPPSRGDPFPLHQATLSSRIIRPSMHNPAPRSRTVTVWSALKRNIGVFET